MPRLVTTTVYIDPAHLEALRTISKKTRVPWSVYVREAIGAWLEDYDDHGELIEDDEDRLDYRTDGRTETWRRVPRARAGR